MAELDWNFWRRMDELDLNAAVCLMIRIDPRSWLAIRIEKNDESHEFTEKARGLFREGRKITELAQASYRQGNLPLRRSTVAISDWLNWCRTKEIEIPAELNLIPIAVSDWNVWIREREYWTVVEAACLLSSVQPIPVESVPEGHPAASIYRRLKDEVLVSKQLGKGLFFLNSPGGQPGLHRVRPLECVAWAGARNISVPAALQELLKGPNSENQKKSPPKHPSSKWPWGNHETDLIRKLAEAAQNFWANYAADDPSTAPTNDQVIRWLQSNGVPGKSTAKAIATILRADGLPAGRRKTI